MSSDIMKVSPTEAYELITAALSMKPFPQVVYLAGPPAIGKSQVVAQVAEDANAKMIDLRLSQILSEDMTGLPEKNEKTGKSQYIPFDMFPLEGDEVPEDYNGWFLFLDELSSATEEVLSAAYSLILDRMVGGRKLHPKCLVVAAGNRSSDSAIARELPDTLITRMLPVEMTVSNKDWIQWAENYQYKNQSVIDFIQKHPTHLYAPAKDRDELETYATPRGWEKVMAHVNFHEKETMKEEEGVDAAGVPTGQMIMSGQPLTDMVFRLISAAVGTMTAMAFRDDYDENVKLPYPWEIAQAPSTMRVPTGNVAKARLMTDISEFFLDSDSQTQDNLMIYINRIGGEYSELFLSTISGKLGTTPTDQKLIKEVSERLNIDPLLGTAPSGGGSNKFPF